MNIHPLRGCRLGPRRCRDFLVVWAALLFLFPIRRGGAEEILRIATIAPQGTSWAREMKAFSSDLAFATQDKVRLRWYLGGIVGDDVQAAERMKRNQIDGVAAGPWLCARWAPSMSVLRLPGIFESRKEALYVANRLRPILDEEFQRADLINLGETGIGPVVFLTRTPIRTFDDLAHLRIWKVDKDVSNTLMLTELGLSIRPMPFEAASKAYEQGLVDGFIAPPVGLLAFQWTAAADYLIDLRPEYLVGCLVLAKNVFERLSSSDQQALRSSAAKFLQRFELVGAEQDAALLGGLFAKQGVQIVHLDSQVNREFGVAAERARARMANANVVPRSLFDRVNSLLMTFREGGQRAKPAAP